MCCVIPKQYVKTAFPIFISFPYQRLEFNVSPTGGQTQFDAGEYGGGIIIADADDDDDEAPAAGEDRPSKFITRVDANDDPAGFAAAWLLDKMPKRRMTSPVVIRIDMMMRMIMIHV